MANRRALSPGVRRRIAAGLAALHLSTLAVPLAQAAEAFPSGATRSGYIADVQSRASLRTDLEQMWKESRFRRQQIEATIDRLRSEEPPAGADLEKWYEERSAKIRWLDDYLRKNEEAVVRYQQNLGSVYEQLEKDRRYIATSSDDQLKQALGSLVGIAGIAGIPLTARPAFGSLGGGTPAPRVVARGSVAGGGLPNPRPPPAASVSAPAAPATGATGAPAATGSAGGAGTTGATAATASGTSGAAGARASAAPGTGSSAGTGTRVGSLPEWRTDISNKGTIQLKRGDRVVDLREQAAVKGEGGRKAPLVRNEAAWQRADSLRQMYTAKDNLSTSLQELRGQLKGSSGQAKKSIQAEIKNLEGQQKALDKDIKAAEKPPKAGGSAVGNLVKSAAKWALFSTALTVGMRAFDQLRANNWDIRSIDWKDAVAPLKTPEFWGGTAGSFGLSMLASAIIPGGGFLKTLAAIGGAAVGWQIGSGNLRHTDWAELGASTLGSTLGTLLGSAIGGPIGAFLGGLAGHFLATWALGKIRSWLEQGATAYAPEDRQVVDLDGDTAPYAGAPPRAPDGPLPPTGEDPATIRARMSEIYSQIESLMRDPASTDAPRIRIRALHDEYDTLYKKLESLRAASGGPSGELVSADGVAAW